MDPIQREDTAQKIGRAVLGAGKNAFIFASYNGATYETVFRMMNEMVEDNAIQMDGKNIIVMSESKLEGYMKE